MSEDFTDEEKQAALERLVVRDVACTAVAALHAACRRYPQDVKAALGSLFDLSLWEKQNRALLATAEAARAATVAVRCLLESIASSVEDLEKKMDAIEYRIDTLTAR